VSTHLGEGSKSSQFRFFRRWLPGGCRRADRESVGPRAGRRHGQRAPTPAHFGGRAGVDWAMKREGPHSGRDGTTRSVSGRSVSW
jgi:hypothetical protein